VAKPGSSVQYILARDLAGTGKFDPAAPMANGNPIPVGANDTRVAYPFLVDAGYPAGPYVLDLADQSDGSTLDLPLTIVPRPQPQAISGRVAVISDTNPAGSSPPDAIIWAYSDPRTPVASAHIQPDGSYMLPVPPGTYIVFSE